MTNHFPYRKEESQIKGKFAPRRPASKKEEAEFGKGEKDILVCKKCGAFYWYKSWHHSLLDYPELEEEKRIKFVLCPACKMILEKKYEGEIILKGVPEDFKEEIKRLIKNYGERAFRKDPMDRIISLRERKISRASAEERRRAGSRKEVEGGREIRVLTTENQLAIRLAKKINRVFGGKLKTSISYSHQEDTVRIIINFFK